MVDLDILKSEAKLAKGGNRNRNLQLCLEIDASMLRTAAIGEQYVRHLLTTKGIRVNHNIVAFEPIDNSQNIKDSSEIWKEFELQVARALEVLDAHTKDSAHSKHFTERELRVPYALAKEIVSKMKNIEKTRPLDEHHELAYNVELEDLNELGITIINQIIELAFKLHAASM